MKNNINLFAILVFGIALLTASCTSNDDDGSNNNNNAQQIAAIENTAESGTWRITSCIDSGQNETNDFSGYNFTFMANGTLMASDGNNTMNGTWSVTDSGSNDDSSDDIDFNMFFNVSEDDPFEDLNDDWDVVSYSDTQINLIDISGGNGGTDTLTFQKN